MSQPAKAQEPSMEEILASIRRIIADDETKPAAKPAAAAPALRPQPPPPPPPPRAPAPPPAPRAVAAPPPPPPTMDQNDVDAMMAGLNGPTEDIVATDPQDVLDLTESMAAPPPAAAYSFQTIDGQPDVIFSDAPTPEPAPRAVEEPRRYAAPPPPPSQPAASAPLERGLLSSSTSSAVDSAFNTLAQTVLVQNGRTLEDLVREMLRPLLKSWLDDNLPGMVERLVRAEIERVSRSRS